MNKPVRHLRNIAVGLIASTCILSFTTPSALATTDGTIAGVRTNNNFKGNGAATTFLSLDPAFDEFNAFQLQPAIRPQYPSVGVNFPSLSSRNLPDVGSFESLFFFYAVPNNGPSADAGLLYFVQTSDGFLHTASSTSVSGKPTNGFSIYSVGVFADQFSPVITAQSINTLNIRYASNDSTGTIYYLVVDGESAILGSNGVINTFDVNTVNDRAFNN